MPMTTPQARAANTKDKRPRISKLIETASSPSVLPRATQKNKKKSSQTKTYVAPSAEKKSERGEPTKNSMAKTKAAAQPAASRRRSTPATTRTEAKSASKITKQAIGQSANEGASISARKGSNSPNTLEVEIKSRRVRAPKDLAFQYGEKTKKIRVTNSSEHERKSRRDAAARQKIKQLMTPDEEVLARLARAGMIASSLAPEIISANGDATKTRRANSVKRRPRSWESRCGKCGALSTFKTPAALCQKCGAIAVRE